MSIGTELAGFRDCEARASDDCLGAPGSEHSCRQVGLLVWAREWGRPVLLILILR